MRAGSSLSVSSLLAFALVAMGLVVAAGLGFGLDTGRDIGPDGTPRGGVEDLGGAGGSNFRGGSGYRGIGPRSAWADGAVDRLTPEELEILRRRFPDWDRRDAAERERIANNVMKLRTLSPEERRRLLERAKKLELAGPDAVNALGQKLRGWHQMSKAEQEQMREKRVFYRGMGAQVVAALPPDARNLVTPGALPTSLTFPERLRLEVGIASRLRQKIVRAFAASDHLLDNEASPGALPPQAQRLANTREALRRAGTSATEEERRRFASMLFEDRLLALRRRLVSVEPDGNRRGERFGAMAKEEFAEAFAAVVADVARFASKGREGLHPLLAEGAENERGGALPNRPLVELVFLLEIARTALTARPGDIAAKAQTFQGELLLTLGWSSEQVSEFAGLTAQERLKRLQPLRRLPGPGAGRGPAGAGGGQGGGRRGPGGDRRGPGGAPPGGQAPGGQPPGGQAPGGQVPGGQAPGEPAPGEQAPSEQPPGVPVPGGPVPGGAAPGGHAPREPAPGAQPPDGPPPAMDAASPSMEPDGAGVPRSGPRSAGNASGSALPPSK